jgi:uncharacterized protein
MRNKKFVLDTNILISYFITNNVFNLIEYIKFNKLIILSSSELYTELERIVSYDSMKKHEIDFFKIKLFLDAFTLKIEIDYPIKNLIPDDENDNFLIALATQNNAGYVVSGDKHILVQKAILEAKYKKLKILNKLEFLEMYK